MQGPVPQLPPDQAQRQRGQQGHGSGGDALQKVVLAGGLVLAGARVGPRSGTDGVLDRAIECGLGRGGHV